MESLIGLVIIGVLAVPVLLIALWVRSASLKRRIEALELRRGEGIQDPAVGALVRRIHALEEEVAALRAGAPPSAAPQAKPEPAKPAPPPPPRVEQPAFEPPPPIPAAEPLPTAAPAPTPVLEPAFTPAPATHTPALEPAFTPAPATHAPASEPAFTSEAATHTPALEPARTPAPAPHPAHTPAPEPVPTFSLVDSLRQKLSGEEWEALVGGSLLNKLGALLLVIGLALLLSYSAARMGPAGRVALALAISLGMIAGGVVLERRRRYLIFARGLLGGGWAALYLTAYAMHALDAARVIANPLAGAVVLIAVAAGMIAHSLRYRAQTVTGLAYFAAFAALAITPVASFSVIALLPLGASLLVIAYRFEWFEMALFGLIATYATSAYKAAGTATVFESQSILAAYWLLFEIFDLLRIRKQRPARGACAGIAPLNAAAALSLSYLKWSATPGAHLWIFFAGAAAVYLASALLRARLRPPAALADAGFLERALSGFEGAITLAAALAVPSIFLGLRGFQINLALLAEAELLFLAGLLLRQNYLRRLAGGVFVISLGKLVGADLDTGHTTLAGIRLESWTPTALATAAIFFLNRALRRPGRGYSYGAAALLAFILAYEAPFVWVGTAWMALALVLFEFGFWTRLEEFRYQGYILGALGGIVRAIALMALPPGHPWLRLGTAALAMFLVTAQVMAIRRLPEKEFERVRDVCSAACTFFLATLIWRVAPPGYLGMAWLALGILCFEAGLATGVRWFRTQGDIVGALGMAALAAINVLALGGVPAHQAIPLAAAALVAYAAAVRIFRLGDAEHRYRRDAALSAGTVSLAALCWYLLPNPLIAVAWGVMALLLLEIGIALPFPAARANGHVLMACGIARLFAANFTISGRSLGISHRLLTVAPFSVLCYYIYDLTAKANDRLSRAYLYAGTILLVFLLRFELGHTMTVVGWAVLVLLLLYYGLRLQKPDLRWQSYALALWTFIRSWNTNFYIPESLAGLRARVLTGAIVIASFYAAELLSPRGEHEIRTGNLRISPRLMFSLLATTLLTALLAYEVSGRLLTVALGVEGIALLAAGFPLRERSLRLAGLALFLFCVLKLFLYDLRQLETLYRILSFIVLGLLLLGASWVYTRFREQLRQYL